MAETGEMALYCGRVRVTPRQWAILKHLRFNHRQRPIPASVRRRFDGRSWDGLVAKRLIVEDRLSHGGWLGIMREG